jgi:hypothetical protein
MAKLVPIIVSGVTLDLTTAEGRTAAAERKAAIIRLRNFGATLETIADKLDMNVEGVEHLLNSGLRELASEPAQDIVGRQQATINDMRRALYPGLVAGDQGAINTLRGVMDHEAKLHGVYAPSRVRVGVDLEEFVTTVEEDMKALGYPTGDGVIEAEVEEDDEPWSNL